jgi:DNA-binding LacI/PurR family transcriptional regulator
MATITDVAHHAGVTTATVSYVLTGKGSVSQATRERVLASVKTLSYKPNSLARSLKQRKSFTIALILPTIANPYYPEMAEEIERIARQNAYQLVLCNTHYDATIGQQYMENLVRRWVDGVLVMNSSMDSPTIVAQTAEKLPIVLCDWSMDDELVKAIHHVNVDFAQGGVLAAQHLLDYGHRHVAIIVEEPGQTVRLNGFRQTLATAGITLPPEYIQQGHSTLESGYQATQVLLALPTPPTAIFATTDWMALGAIEAVTDAGLRMPEEVSVIGLDNILLSKHMRPPLTTVAIPRYEFAQTATQLLLQLIEGANDLPLLSLVSPSIIIRGSTTRCRE